MALFKILKGQQARLPNTSKQGYAYYTTDKGKFYIFNSATQRRTLNPDIKITIGNQTKTSTTLSPEVAFDLASIGVAAAGHNHDNTYVKKAGDTMNGTAVIAWPDSGNWGNSNKNVTFPVVRGGLSWSGQSDYIKLNAVETGNDNLQLYLQFGDDNSNGLSIRNAANQQTARISASGIFTGNGSGLTNLPAGNLTGTISMDRIADRSIGNGKLTNSKITIAGKDVSLGGSLTLADIGAAAAGHNHDGTYLKLSGGTITGDLTVNGRLQAYGTLCINANIDNLGTQYVILTAGHGMSSSLADGLAIGSNTLTWKNTNVVIESGTWSINISGSARYLQSPDTRLAAIIPSEMSAANGVSFDFKQASTINLTTASYSGVMSYRPYASGGDWTGGHAHQLAFNDAGLYWRKSVDNNTWGNWKTIAFTDSTVAKATDAVNASALSGGIYLDTVAKLDAFLGTNKLLFAKNAGNLGTASDGLIVSAGWSEGSWGHQLFLDDSQNIMQHRSKYTLVASDGTKTQAWEKWETLIDSGNYTDYTVKKDGTGASGTWGINITGNAVTSTIPLGFASCNTNVTWGNQTGTTITCWDQSSGGSVEFRRNNPSNGKLSIKVNGRFYGNEGSYPAMLIRLRNNYWGLGNPDGDDSDQIRTTVNGLIPFQSGGQGNGHSALGTSSWYFKEAFIDTVNGTNLYLRGQTANRLVWLNGSKMLDTAGHYASGSKVAINSTSEPGYNFYVNGTSYLNGILNVTSTLQPTSTNTQTLGTSSLRWAKVYIGTADTYGSTIKGVYWNAGVPTAMTYELKSTVNNGTATSIAYYSGTNAVSSGSIVTDGSFLHDVSSLYVTKNDWEFALGHNYTNQDAYLSADAGGIEIAFKTANEGQTKIWIRPDFIYIGKKESDGGFHSTITTDNASGSITMTGQLEVGDKVKLWTDNEGGNIDLIDNSSTRHYQFDAFDGNLRLYSEKCSDNSGYLGITLLDTNGNTTLNNIYGNAQHLFINGVTWSSNWNWSGQGGQPAWLWGSNDGSNMYVWNPSNFSVDSADHLRGTHGHLIKWGWTGHKLQAYVDNVIVRNWDPTWPSDRRLKKNIKDISDRYLKAIGKIKLVQFNYNQKSYIFNDNLLHFGAIAQDIMNSLHQQGLNESNSNLILKTQINKNQYYEIDYTSFLILRIAYDQQKSNKQIQQLKQQILKLKSQIQLLNAKLDTLVVSHL